MYTLIKFYISFENYHLLITIYHVFHFSGTFEDKYVLTQDSKNGNKYMKKTRESDI